MPAGFRVLKPKRDSMFRMSAGGARLRLAYCQAKGFAGIVINGAVRDVGYVRAHYFPVYAAGVTHRGPYRNGPGEINVTLALDGMAIAPGDLVLGDDDGLLCVPYDDMETRTFQDIGKGDNSRVQFEKTLRGLGCEFES
jgi:regulator of RNase E activity RraA